jgi:hypothetical protein
MFDVNEARQAKRGMRQMLRVLGASQKNRPRRVCRYSSDNDGINVSLSHAIFYFSSNEKLVSSRQHVFLFSSLFSKPASAEKKKE